MKRTINLTINGKRHSHDVEPRLLLIHYLREVVALTGARGLMIGRGVIRNPWLFRQIREMRRAKQFFVPAGAMSSLMCTRSTRR